MSKKVLSVIIPVFNENEMIQKNIQRVKSVLQDANIPHEIILIDDGSKDNSWSEIQNCVHTVPDIKGIKLSRNFGKENALCAGLDQAEGDCCICMDADMQHPPEVIPRMYELWKNEGFDIVEGIKQSRGKESLRYKVSAGIFYKILHKTSGIDLNNASDFRLLDRKAINAWKAMPEKQTFFRGMSSWIGFSRTQVEFIVADREIGTSKWSFISLVKLAIKGVTSYTAAPLYASAFLGFGLLVAFVFLLGQTIIMKILGYAAGGFTTVIALQLVIGGTLMMSVGVIGIYIEKIYEEVKARPRYIIENIAEHLAKKNNE
ncbi:glycosyltransferase family 2 protein [Cellvibrio mixtus]|uniref:glycosyltransferase family 2 protein n=1 Tax=Cellvibrio mixtus TaxID=39650 RepID=UPI001482BBA7|nr:glycosyltransferase family 2 protein [Cellvibrio mixtus]